MIARAIVNTLGEALGGGEGGGGGRGQTRASRSVRLVDGRRAEVISASAMLTELGVAH